MPGKQRAAPLATPLATITLADAAFAAAAALLALAIYLVTVAPSVATIYDDSLELQVVCSTLGIAHPTGYPLYTLLGWLFTLIPVGDPAFRVNLMSAVFGGVAVGLVYMLCRQLFCYRAAALTGAMALAISPVFWSQATIAEVYTLNAAFLAATLWLALWAGSARDEWPTALKRMQWLAVVYGFSLTHHRMSLLLLPPLVAYLWWGFGKRMRPRIWGRLALLVALPLLLYAYLPLRGQVTSSLDGTYTNTLQGFIQYIAASSYDVFLGQSSPVVPGKPLSAYVAVFASQFGILGWVFIAAGIAFLWGRAGQRLLVGSSLLLNLIFAVAYRVQDAEVFCIPAIIILAVMLALGLDFLLKVMFGLSQRAGRGWAVAGVGLAVILWVALLKPLPLRWLAEDRSHDWAVHDQGLAWLQAPQQDGAVVGILGETVLLKYFQVSQGLRPDVQLFPADDQQVRLDTVRWLVGKGTPTYLTRPLAGAPERFALDAAGPLIHVSALAQTAPSNGYGRELLPGLHLLSWQPAAAEEHGRAYVNMRVSWLVTQPLDRSLKVSARLSRDGQVVASLDTIPVHNAYPTTYWRPESPQTTHVIDDDYRINMPVGDPGGPVDVTLVLYDAESGAEVARVGLGTGSVAASAGPRSLAEWQLRPRPAQLIGGYALLATSLQASTVAKPGDVLPVELLWANDGAPSSGDLPLSLVLERGGKVVASQPVALSYDGWRPHTYLRQAASFALPANLLSGRYRLILAGSPARRAMFASWAWPPLSGSLPLAMVEVRAREHDLQPPKPQQTVDITLSGPEGAVARLVGYDLDRQGDLLELKLYWQALAQPGERLKVFVHCVDQGGTIVAQDDSEPAGGAAPASSWVQGEYIADAHRLVLPAAASGPLRILVGMYGPDGQRLAPSVPAPGESGAVLLAEIRH